MNAIENLLNREQLMAVTAADGPLLVLAAAGTGKTHTLVHRVAHLVARGVPPDSILLLTFTNRAAREMLERAKKAAGEQVGNVWSGTFHHVCNRFLRRFGDRLGFTPDFTILDRDDTRSLINEGIQSLRIPTRDFPGRDVLAALFSNAASRGLAIEDAIEAQIDQLKVDPVDIARVYSAYVARKRELGAMDFDDLLINGLRLLREDATIRDFYQRKFHHVLVDEYQDTNGPQAQLADLLAGRHGNVMAVGDDFQCIYSWRGADFRNIMEFPKRHPACRIVKLEQNYRSAPEILAVANACISGNPGQFQKTLRATRPARAKPRVFFPRDGDDQARTIALLIERYRQDGYRLGDMAVLYRAHFHSIELQMALTRAGLHYAIASGLAVFEQAHVKDVIAFLRACAVPHDRLAFERLLGLLHGVGAKTIDGWWRKLGGRFDSRDAQQRATLMTLMRPAARAEWTPIDALLGAYHAEGLETNGGEIIKRFFDAFYYVHLMRVYENGAKRGDDVNELAVQIMLSPSVPAFLHEVALLTNMDHSFDRQARDGVAQDALHLSTVHQAKGMEWPVVFVIWASEGMFPSSRTLGESGDDAEERRLFYVAVTRAKDELCLCAPEMRRTRDGGVFSCKPSRFVEELPSGLVRERYGTRVGMR